LAKEFSAGHGDRTAPWRWVAGIHAGKAEALARTEARTKALKDIMMDEGLSRKDKSLIDKTNQFHRI
jgi:hypothetical protein